MEEITNFEGGCPEQVSKSSTAETEAMDQSVNAKTVDQSDIAKIENVDQSYTDTSKDSLNPSDKDKIEAVNQLDIDTVESVNHSDKDIVESVIQSDNAKIESVKPSDKDKIGFVNYSDNDKLGSVDQSDNGKLRSVDQSDNDKLGSVDQSDNGKLRSVDQSDNDKLGFVDQSDNGKLRSVDQSDNDKLVSVDRSDECILMEYRSTSGKKRQSDGETEDSSSSSDESDEDKDDIGSDDDGATDAKINKVLSHVRDNSPEGRRNIKMNRYGFEDIRTKGELMPEDLPPLEELTITVDENVEMMCVGKIASIVGELVVIQSNTDVPPLNDDSILFVEGRKVLGQVFETFGQVKNPWYSVRFNDSENIKAKELQVAMPVYCAPKEDCFTRYVFVDSLKQMKGSDASWEHNNEPPDKYIDYSDDESERRAKAKRKNKKNQDDGEKNGENWEKKNKNEYNQQKKQNYGERSFRGPQGGGNPRHTNPRNTCNPFQGYDDQQTQRPRYASGQYSNPADSSRSFNGDGWSLYRQNRGNQYNNGTDETDRYTGDRFSNFGGPPRFSSGPHFNGDNSGSQFQPNQTFGNRNAPFPSQGPQFNGNNPRPWGQQQNNQSYGNQFEQNRIPGPPFNGNESRQKFQQQSNASLGNQMTQRSTSLPQFNGNGPVQQQSNRFGNQLPNNQGFGNQQTINQGFRNQPPNIQGFGNQPPNNQGFGNQQPNNQGFGNQLQNNQGFGNQQGFENQRPNNQVFGNQQLNNQGFGNQQQNSKDFGIQQPNNHSFRNMNENNQPGIDYRGNGPRQQLPPENILNYERKNEQNLSSGSQTSWNGPGSQCQNNLSFGNLAGHRQLPDPPISRPQFQQQNNPPVGIQTGQNLPLPNVQLNNDNPSRLTNQGPPVFSQPQGFMNNFRQQQPPSGSLSAGSSTSGRFPAPQVRGSMPNFR